MKRFAALAVITFFLAAAFPLVSQAQMEPESTFKVGPRLTIALNDLSDVGADFAIGGDARYNLSAEVDAPVQLAGSFDFYFAKDAEVTDQGQSEGVSRTVFTVDLNGHYMFPNEGAVSPYAGAGIGITNVSIGTPELPGIDRDDLEIGDVTDIGLNLIGGIEYKTDSFRPFAQAQLSLGGDFTRFGITGGVLFDL